MSLTSLDVIYILFIICLKLTSFEHQTNAVKKELDIEQYGSFFNVGRVKLYKTPGSLQNQIHKSKVEILGEVLKHRVELLRKGATNKEVELVFLVDSSASVGAENFFNEVKFVKKLLADFTVSYNSTRVALVTFSSKSRVVRQIDHLTNASGRNHKCRLLDEELPKINYIGGGTYTMGALLEARAILEAARPNAAKVVFLVTDGYSNGGDPRPASKKLRDQGVEVFTFGIKNGNVRELYDMASWPPEEHSYILDSFEEFEALARRALHEDLHIGNYEEDEPNSCGGLCEEGKQCCDSKARCTCGTHTGHYACLCQKGYYGTGLREDCKACPAGTYLDKIGPADVTACKPCPDLNHYSDPGSSSVHDCRCRKGYVSHGTSCVEMECPELKPPENGYFVKGVCNNAFNAACGIRCNPGYTLVGSSIRLCIENGQWSGEQPSCAIKNCTALKQPRHGRMVCDNEFYSFETACNFSCDPGFFLVGSKTRTCLAIASWDGLPSHCRPVTCQPLPPLKHGSVSPAKCSTQKSQYSVSCEYGCNPGFILVGPAKRQCMRQGTWTSPEKKTKCIDVSPPNITCPSDIHVSTDVDESYASVKWDPPIATDNSGEEPLVTSRSVLTFPVKFPIGETIITYIAEDKAQNVAKCNFTVHVTDSQPPTIDSCTSPPTFLSRDKNVDILWEEPVFSDNSDGLLLVNRSHDFGPFPFGATDVTYIAIDEAGNNATCVIIITVQEHACSTPVDPINGHANCSELQDGVICSLTCEEGYAFAFRPPSSYFCTYDGIWTPKKDSQNRFPDCSLTNFPSDAFQKGVITLHSDDVPCDDTFFLHQVETKFQEKLSNKITQHCTDEIDCDITYVSAACEEYLMQIDGENGYTLRRRRRDVSERSADSLLESNNTTLSADVGLFKPRRFQKVALEFLLTGSIKLKVDLNLTADSPFLLRDAIVQTLENLKEDAKRGELDLKLGRRHLTYSGFRSLIHLPEFVCDDGSILLDDLCVNCPVGTFYNIVKEVCEPCPRGSYQFTEAQLACLVCPGNTSTSFGHSRSFDDCKAQCLPGSFSSTGLEACETCPKGSYQPHYSQKECISCPANTTTRRRGARKLEQCKELCPNGHVSKTGLVPCYACPSGYYQSQAGQRVCFRCSDGTRTKGVGSISAQDCLDIPEEVKTETAKNDSLIEELTVNDCFSIPCLNGGTCHILQFGFTCYCASGFTGMFCDVEIDECDSSPCQNGGTCTDRLSDYVCQCSSGYDGRNCEDDVDECSSTPCLNGGSCVDQINDFRCICAGGFHGKICQTEINECVSSPCQNGGSCVDIISGYRCLCPVGFVGEDCQTNVDECDTGPCANGATCFDLDGGFRCICQKGFSGDLCDANIDECSSNPCTNGGTCVDKIDSFKCHCPPGYADTLCQTELSSDFMMEFPISGIMDYALTEGFRQDLSQITSCFWIKTNDHLNYGTPFSYANQSFDNLFTLTDYNGFVLYVNGEKVITDVTANDDHWHFICVSWSSAKGQWKIYKDGLLNDEGQNLASGSLIPGDGIIVIGQEQDTAGGGFSAAESFIGFIGWVDFWNLVLSPQEITKLSTTCDSYKGSAKAWPDFLTGIRGRVKLKESVFCRGCPDPGRYENGVVNSVGSGLESVLRYSCNPGYRLKGSVERECAIHGGWEGKEPKCEMSNCGFPGYLENGQIHGNGYLYRDLISYRCKAGYRLVGNETRVCQEDGRWQGEPPICVKILCPPPLPPENGDIFPRSSRYGASALIRYSCDAGFRLDGPHTVTCGSDGSWDESPPTCQPVLCSEPPNLQNGFVEDVSKVVRVGENVSLACIEGYRLVGPHYLLCSAESRWEGDMPHCISVDCGRPPKIPNSNFSMDDTVLGSVVTYQCHDGFEPNDAIGTQMTCNTTGHWQGSSKELRCLPVSCPPLQSIRYGDLKMTGIRLGNNVTYSCMEGYELTGDRVRICQANGSWSGHAPHCSQVRCNTPEDVNGGWFEGSAPWVAGTTLIYSCHPGYRRMGPSQLTCLDSGRWSAQKPECLLVECPVPNPIPGGFYELNLNNDLVYRSVVTYDCDEGFTLIGNATRECAENGSWSGVMPMCKKVSCDSVGNIEHGRVELDSFFYFSKVNYTCDEGFIIQGPQTRVCLANGTWSGVEPKCIGALCPVPEPLRHGEIRVSDLGRGGAVEYSCQEGFVLDGQIQRRCQTDSTGLQLYWSGDQPKCIAINCTTPDDVPNGSVQAPTLRYGSFAEYTCATGYDLIGPAIRRCLSDGSWSNNTPVCLLQECPRPTAEDIVKGRTLGGNYGVGAIVQFECEVGYKISGHSNLTCTTNKTWSGPIPSCIPISCSKTLFAPFNGHITMDSNLFGSRVRYSCLEDFELRGDVERVCLADGTWSGEEPSCLPIHLEDITALRACDSNDQLSNGSLAIVGQNCLNASCPDPEPILHGVQRVYGNGTYGTTVYVECQAEYSLVGSEIRQCLKNGTWNGVAPSCISIECPIPQTPQNGNLELDGTMVGSTVQYGCHRGYKIIGDSLSTCMRDGTWSRAVPECQPIECPKLIAPDNGHVTVEGYNFGNVARYNCDPGYDLNDDELRVCLENQTWSGKNPQCEAIVCPVPELVNGGQVSAPSLTLGSIARYSCFQGRSLQGLDTRICMTNRIWNGSVPLCELIICPPLNSIPNGRLLGLFEDDHQYNETVSFECNPTFGLQGKHELRCLEDGAWDGSPPVCVRTHCERPPLVLEASVTGNSTTIGSIIEYECRVGFRLVGESSRRCLSNGHWSGKIPTCVPVSCGQPPEVANASTQLIIPAGQESNSYGSTVVYICNDGYDLTGSPALICEADGSWFGQIPSCQHLTCGPPHVIPHATVRVESYEQLSRAVYLCDDGFTMITGGLTVVHCLPGGVWDVNEKLLQCIPVICPPPANIINGRTVVDSFEFGSFATFSCNPGFRKVPASSWRVTCSAKGTWQGGFPRCVPITCPPPEVPSNSVIEEDESEYQYGAMTNYTCRHGFRLVGNTSRTCLETGQWSGSVPQCHRIQCEEPEPPKNGYVMFDDRKFGDVARFTCEDGYFLEGASQVTCDENGNWTLDIPVCQVATCNELPDLDHAHLSAPIKGQYIYNEELKFECDVGFVSSGDTTFKCQSNGTWITSSGNCSRVSCGPPQITDGITVEGSSFLYGDTVTYTCPLNLQPKGSNVLTCKENGSWDAVPACEALCPNPCLNGGTCIGSSKCRCLAGYLGDRCQNPFCFIPCLHGGTCIAFNRCSCVPGYTGRQCLTPVCDPPCSPGQRCTSPNTCA